MSDFFVTGQRKLEEKMAEAQNKAEAPEIKKFTPEVLEVRLSSLGKLDIPAVVHVHDYTMDDALKLSLAEGDFYFQRLMEVMDNIIEDDIDVTLLHEKEMEEILLTLYANYWDSVIHGFPYPYTQEELEACENEDLKRKIQEEGFVPRIDIPIKDIQTNEIPEDFKEPIKIEYKGKTIKVKLQRIQNILLAQEYVNKKYIAEKKKFDDLESVLEYNEKVKHDPDKVRTVDSEKLSEYKKFIENRDLDYLRYMQAFSLVEFEGQLLETIEDKINAYSHIDLRFWSIYSEMLKQIDFGVVKEMKVKSPLTKKKVTRRFQFRLMDFIPDIDTSEPTEYTISFGD
jgi:hypothetical protein